MQAQCIYIKSCGGGENKWERNLRKKRTLLEVRRIGGEKFKVFQNMADKFEIDVV